MKHETLRNTLKKLGKNHITTTESWKKNINN